MTVAELIKKLSELDPDSPVLVYNERCEDDYNIVDAVEIYPEVEEWEGDTYYHAPYYCQGYGIAKQYFENNNGKFPVVLLKTDE